MQREKFLRKMYCKYFIVKYQWKIAIFRNSSYQHWFSVENYFFHFNNFLQPWNVWSFSDLFSNFDTKIFILKVDGWIILKIKAWGFGIWVLYLFAFFLLETGFLKFLGTRKVFKQLYNFLKVLNKTWRTSK